MSPVFRSAIVCLVCALTAPHVRAGIPLPYPKGTAFPLELYEVRAGDAPALAAAHWNIFQTYGISNTNDYNDYLSKLRSSDTGAMALIPCLGSKTDKVEWPAARAKGWISAIANNANLVWWDLPEEARPWSAHELKMLRDYTDWSHANDPLRRPTYEYTPNNRNAAELSHIVPAVDVIGISCYCEEMRMPHAWVRYKIEEAGLHGIALAGATVGRDFLHGQKIPVAILYCAKFPKTGQMPTPDQTYHDFWSAIVSGAQGIGVYAFHHAMKDDASLAKNFARLNEAAAQISGPEQLGDIILWGERDARVGFEVVSGPEKTVSFRPPSEKIALQYPSLNLQSKTRNGRMHIIAVNSTDQIVVARITGLPADGASASVPFENRSVNVASGSFTDSFPPWGVHIYSVDSLK